MTEYYLGIDLGGTKISAAVLDQDGAILGRARAKTESQTGQEAIFDRIVATARQAVEASGIDTARIRALGIGSPGPLDTDTGVILESCNLPFRDFPLGLRLSEAFHCPAVVENDVSVATYAEYRVGAARDRSVVLGMFIGTGIGGGIVIDGHLYRGFTKNASEVGHIVVKAGGPKCNCGSRGCLEALASRTAIVRDIRRAVKKGRHTTLRKAAGHDLSTITSGVLRDAFEEDDKLTVKVLRRAARYMGIGIGSLINVLGPQTVVLGGGVMTALGDYLMNTIRSSVEKTAFAANLKGVEILPAQLGDDAGIIGAALLARERPGAGPESTAEVSARPSSAGPDRGGEIF